MKKFYSILAAALLCLNINAQVLNESFEDTQFPPEGWSSIDSDSYSKWKRVSKEDNEQLNVYDGLACAVVPGSYGTENWLITPCLRPEAGQSLTFAARVGDYAKNGQLRIEVSTDGTNASSFTLIDTYYTSSSAEDSHRIWKSDWKEFTVDLSAYEGQRIFVAFHQVGEADRIYVDAVKGLTLAGDENCEAPYSIKVSDVQANGATFSWTGTATQYQYTVAPEGEPAIWINAKITEETSVTLTGLFEATAYNFYLRSYCSESEQSLVSVTPFSTICSPEAIPFVETFYHHSTGAVAPECWTVASAKPQVWVVIDKTYDEEGDGTLIRGSEHIYAQGGGPNTAQVFAMPAVDADLTTLEVAFDYKTSMATDAYGKLEIGYMLNPRDAASFVSLQTLPQILEYSRVTVTLETLPAEARFIAFRFAGGTSDFSGASLDNFVVAPIGHSEEFKPEETIDDADAYLLGQTYCEAQISWYAYNVSAFGIGLFNSTTQEQIAAIFATTEECDLFAYYDGVAFSEYEDPDNHYYCSTKWILNADETGLMKFEGWEAAVTNIGTATSPLLGLKPGKYQVQIYKYTPGASSLGDHIGTVPFELVSKEVTNLQAEVAADKTTATLTWDTPELANGERLYVSVRAGETVAYDNFETVDVATSPLVVEVIEGKSYTATIQIIDRHKDPVGAEVACGFTVGVNPYEPQDPVAEVFGGDNVTFGWNVISLANFYEITLFLEGEFYTTLNVVGKCSKTTTMPKDGTWSWTVQAFTEGSNGNYFPASNAVPGNDFVTKAADIPEDAIVLEVAEMDAFYLDPDCQYYQEGLNGWVVQFATGEKGAPGYPLAWFLIYTAKPAAISGVYNVPRGNIDLESCMIIPEASNTPNYIMATDAELRLQFEEFDQEYFDQGYRYGIYTGSFRIVGNDGKTYVAKFMQEKCNSFSWSSYESGLLAHEGMWDEDPDSPWEAIDQITNDKSQLSNKILRDGQLLIIRDGKTYNAQGALVK